MNILAEEAVDVCVLDIRMPGMDGMEVLKKRELTRIKSNHAFGIVQRKYCKTALQLGADAFVAKPFQAECLVSRIG